MPAHFHVTVLTLLPTVPLPLTQVECSREAFTEQEIFRYCESDYMLPALPLLTSLCYCVARKEHAYEICP